MGSNWVRDHLLTMRTAALIVRAVASRLRTRPSRTLVTAGIFLLLTGQWAPPAQAKNLLFYEPALATYLTLNEAIVAAAQGHTVTLADAAEWSRMSTEQFASYDAIVFPDYYHYQNLTPYEAAESNKATWSAAIKGPQIIFGNATLDDPLRKGGAEQLVANGLNFAASGPGTGL